MSNPSPGKKSAYVTAFQTEVDRLSSFRDVALLDQIQRIIDLAKSHNDSAAVIEWQCALIEASSHCSRFDRELAAFQGLMDLYRSEPGASDIREMALWYYKWVAEELVLYPDVDRDQIDGFFQQMASFYADESESPTPIYALRYASSAFMGRGEDAETWRERWESSDAGDSDDCAACQTHTRVQAHLDLDDADAAIDAAAPLFKGEQACDSIPAKTFSRLLLPVLMRDNVEMCVALIRAVRRQVRHTPNMLSHLADHVVFLSLVPSPQTARRNACILLRGLARTPSPFDRYCAARAAWIWARRRMNNGAGLDLPKRIVLELKHDDDDVLVAWLFNQMHQLAEAFDRRNGTRRFNLDAVQAEQIVDMNGELGGA